MGVVAPRCYGGLGFMVDRIAVHMEFRNQNTLSIEGIDGLDQNARDELVILLDRLAELHGIGAGISLISHGPQHVGLGSKTALKLSTVAGYLKLCGKDL